MPDTTITTEVRRTFAKYLSGEEFAYATTLMAICAWLYGTEFIGWEPATLRLQLTEDVVAPDDKVLDKIQAAILAVTDDNVFDDAVVFHQVSTALCDLDVVIDEWDEPEGDEIAWAVMEMYILRGEKQDFRFSPEVAAYAGVVLMNEGLVEAPKILDWAQMKGPEGLDEYSDDPLMFKSLYDDQVSRSRDIDDFVNEHARKLLEQVRRLPLGAGDWLNPEDLFEDD